MKLVENKLKQTKQQPQLRKQPQIKQPQQKHRQKLSQQQNQDDLQLKILDVLQLKELKQKQHV